MPSTLDFPPPNANVTFPTSTCQTFNTLIPTVQTRQVFSLRAFTTIYKSSKHWLPPSHPPPTLIFQTTWSCSIYLQQGQARGSIYPDTEQHYQRPSKVSKWNLKFARTWHLLETVALILAGIMLNRATQYALEHIPIVAENHSPWKKMVGGPVEKCKSSGILWHK